MNNVKNIQKLRVMFFVNLYDRPFPLDNAFIFFEKLIYLDCLIIKF